MSKLLLKDEQLEAKINKFIARKNRELGLQESKELRSKPIFNFKNDSVTLAY